MILQLRFWNSGCNPAMYPSSVVHTGVKSLGCENKMAQPLPIHSWKLIVPCEVSAVKLGASSFMRNMVYLLVSCYSEAGGRETSFSFSRPRTVYQPEFPIGTSRLGIVRFSGPSSQRTCRHSSLATALLAGFFDCFFHEHDVGHSTNLERRRETETFTLVFLDVLLSAREKQGRMDPVLVTDL